MEDNLDIIVVRCLQNKKVEKVCYINRDSFVSYKDELKLIYYFERYHEFIIGMAPDIESFLEKVEQLPLPQRYWLN